MGISCSRRAIAAEAVEITVNVEQRDGTRTQALRNLRTAKNLRAVGEVGRELSVLTVPSVAGNGVVQGAPTLPAPETNLAESSTKTTPPEAVALDRNQNQSGQVLASTPVNRDQMSSVVESLISELDQALAAQPNNGANNASFDVLLTLRTSLDAWRHDQTFESIQIRQTKSAVIPLPSWIMLDP